MLKVYGASDDLIEIEGDIREEFNWYLNNDEHRYLAFSDGTVLKVWYDEDGLWRFQKLFTGSLFNRIEQGDVDEDRCDVAYFDDGVKWVVSGKDLAK